MGAAYPGNMSKPWTGGPRGASGNAMDERSPPKSKSGVPNRTRRDREPTNGKPGQTDRASAFAQAAEVVAGLKEEPREPLVVKPPRASVPTRAAFAPAEPARGPAD